MDNGVWSVSLGSEKEMVGCVGRETSLGAQILRKL